MSTSKRGPEKVTEFAPFSDALKTIDQLLQNSELATSTRSQLNGARETFSRSLQRQEVMLRKFQYKTAKRVKRLFRNAIVGSPDESLRQHMAKTTTISQVDQFAFTFSILNGLFLEFLILKMPEWLGLYYAMVLTSLMIARYYFYKSLNYHYFLFDFCYAVNFVCMLHLVFNMVGLSSPTVNTVLFVLVSVPLWGIIVWRNSMVFHSIDKMTSMFIHLLPTFYLFSRKWQSDDEFADMDLWHFIIYPAAAWWIWQAAYQVKTELLDDIDRTNLDTITSLRWIANDKSNGMTKFSLNLSRTFGIHGKDEFFDDKNIRTKLVWVVVNFVYFCGVIIPSYVFFYSMYSHIVFIILVLVVSVLNGGSYYINVFSQRYFQKLDKRARELESTLKLATPDILEEAHTAKTPDLSRKQSGMYLEELSDEPPAEKETEDKKKD